MSIFLVRFSVVLNFYSLLARINVLADEPLMIVEACCFFNQHHKPPSQPLMPGTIEQKLNKTRSLK